MKRAVMTKRAMLMTKKPWMNKLSLKIWLLQARLLTVPLPTFLKPVRLKNYCMLVSKH
jgi:hypothetical protein